MGKIDLLRSAIDRKTPGKTESGKRKWIQDYFLSWSIQKETITPKQFQSALASLKMPPEVAHDVWAMLDSNDDGKLSIEEIAIGLTAPVPATQELHTSSHAVGPMHPKADVIQKNEIKQMYDCLGPRIYDAGFRSVPALLRVMDDDNSGFLNRLEFRAFLKSQFNFPGERSDRYFNLLDMDGDGKVDTKEFGYAIAPYLDLDGDGNVGDEGDDVFVPSPRGHNSVRSKRRENEVPAGLSPRKQIVDHKYVPPLTLPQPPAKQMQKIDLSEIILTQVRGTIAKRGNSQGMHTLYRTFRAIAVDKQDDNFSPQDIRQGFEHFGIKLKEKDLHLLMSALDDDDSLIVDLNELTTRLRGQRPTDVERLHSIEKAWRLVDRRGDVSIDLEDLLKQFNPANHPEVMAKRMRAADAVEDMRSQFSDFLVNGRVKRETFFDYHKNLSTCIDDYQLFDAICRSSWCAVKEAEKGWAGSAVRTDKKASHGR